MREIINETCRDLQAKVIKSAAFCQNRALRDLYPDNYQLLFTAGSFTLTASPFLNELNVSAFNESARKDRNLLVLVEYEFADVH